MEFSTVAEALKVIPEDKLLINMGSPDFECLDDLDKFCLILHQIKQKDSSEISINDLIDNVSIIPFQVKYLKTP